MTLGEKIAKQRKELNYTQEQLADILDVSRQSISKWESDIAYIATNYNDIRCIRLQETIYPASIVALAAMNQNRDVKAESRQKSIPEFMRFNIVECDVRGRNLFLPFLKTILFFNEYIIRGRLPQNVSNLCRKFYERKIEKTYTFFVKIRT